MRRIFFLLFFAIAPTLYAQIDSAYIAARYRETALRIIAAAMKDSVAFERLAELCDTFGPRFSGSENLERAIDWCLAKMKADGFDNVRGEPVMVPRWVRGAESCELVSPRPHKMAVMGLGGTIPTPKKGITAEVLVVRDFDELEARAAEAKGKIVLFNTPFTQYGQTVRVRTLGAQRAAKVGAVASLIRSVGPFSLYTPHTGAMTYVDSIPKIPHAAISLEDAEMLARMQKRGQKVVVKLLLNAKQLPDAPSRNVIAEIRGTEKPDEVVVFGGHIDSWDVGQGAMDDGGGCVAAWHALKIIKDLGLRARRTLRVVLWTNEENGFRGATAYADAHKHERHVLAIESDAGVFKPTGFGFTGRDSVLQIVKAIAHLLAPIEASRITIGGGGADIAPLMQQGVPGLGLQVDGTRYFWYHHTHADTIDKLNPEELNRCVAAMAIMAFVAADLP
ncbi:MAG: M28 family metallopeptidase [Chloroherpetonaceae bacterium]|nr:M28 family metallopeptidase [Chloroherpetonaceae bacterium]MDW8020523.1 M28 family metallopeptidase [Chloroherpetonaceae bacterium]